MNRIHLHISFFSVLLALSGFSVQAAESVGKVLAISGRCEAIDIQNKERVLKRGDVFWQGERLRCGKGSQAQAKFVDGALFSLNSDTEFRVDAYAIHQPKEEDTSEVTLLKGSFRTLTGLIAQQKPKGYKVKTSVATIGLRASIECDKLLKQAHSCSTQDTTFLAMNFGDGVLTASAKQDAVTITTFGAPEVPLPEEEEEEEESVPVLLNPGESIKIESNKPPQNISSDEFNQYTQGILNIFPSLSLPGTLGVLGVQSLPQGSTLTRATQIGVEDVQSFAAGFVPPIPLPPLPPGVLD